MGLGAEARLLLAIIKLADGGNEVRRISEKSRIPLSIVMEEVRMLEDEGLVRLKEGRVEASPYQRLRMAVLAIKGGVSVESACRALGWREFEDLAALILELNGFTTHRHFRFRNHSRRFEIDVLGLKEPFILLIECKRWSKSWLRAATIRIVERHLERTEAFMDSFQRAMIGLEVDGWRGALFIPLIITLSETPLKCYSRVPIIPIFHFRNFLNDEMSVYLGDLRVYGVKGFDAFNG